MDHHQNLHRWLRRDAYQHADFPFWISGFVSAHARLKFSSTAPVFLVLPIAYSQEDRINFGAKYVKRRGSVQGCALGSFVIILPHWGGQIPETPILGAWMVVFINDSDTANNMCKSCLQSTFKKATCCFLDQHFHLQTTPSLYSCTLHAAVPSSYWASGSDGISRVTNKQKDIQSLHKLAYLNCFKHIPFSHTPQP